jgi:hypothetical protein
LKLHRYAVPDSTNSSWRFATENHAAWPVRSDRRERVEEFVVARIRVRADADRAQKALDRPANRLAFVDYGATKGLKSPIY